MRGQRLAATLLVLLIVVFVAATKADDRPAPASHPSTAVAHPQAQQPTATAQSAPKPKQAISTTKASIASVHRAATQQAPVNPELSGPTTWHGWLWVMALIIGPCILLTIYHAIVHERPSWWIRWRYGIKY